MKARNTTLTVVMILAAVLAASTALAQGPGRGGCGSHGPMFGPGAGDELPPMMVERLDLSEDQQAAIAEIRAKARAEGVELRKEMLRLRNELQGEMLKDEPSEKTLVDLTERMGELRTRMQIQRVKTRLAVRRQLTPEQRDRMLMMGAGRHGAFGPGGRGPGMCGPGRSGRNFGGGRGFGPGFRSGCDGSGPGAGAGRGAGWRFQDDQD